MYRLGINVGSTNTDSVLMDQNFNILGTSKQPTTPDIVTGIASVLDEIVNHTAVNPQQITAVMIGTTHLFNSLLKGSNLAKVGVIRINQAKSAVPPFFDAPDSLRDSVGLTYLEVSGGHEVDGSVAGNEPKRLEIEQFLRNIPSGAIESFVISGTFSPVNDSHERMVAGWIQEILGDDFPVTLSHELGSVGFIERENAAILNAALARAMMQTMKGLGVLFRKKGINAAIYFTQNDGTLMSYEYALRYPIRTLRSGITNSFRGVSFLTGIEDCVIVEVGGVSTHVGVLEGGFPKERGKGQTIAGVRVNVHMPEIISLQFSANDPVDDMVLDKLFQAIQRFQPHYEPLPIVFVGGMSNKFVSQFKYPWSEVILPDHHQYANAIGACIAPVSGTIDRMYWLKDLKQEEALELAKQEAIQAAVQAGALRETVVIQSMKTIPLAYVPSKALRIKVKAIGSLSKNLKGVMC